MFALLLGSTKSGKSRCAEKLAYRLHKGRLLYVATMIPVGIGEAGDARVQRHRVQREGLGFITVECPRDLGSIPIQPEDTVLLEDVSNLVANHLFQTPPSSADAVLADIRSLARRCKHLVVVTLADVVHSPEYDQATNQYITALQQINAQIGQMADEVVLMKNGQPIPQKGNLGADDLAEILMA